MGDCMEFPKDWEKFLEDYSFKDKEEIYTNGARLIPTFRVEQMMEHYLQKATEDAVPVVHGRWKYFHKKNIAVCTECSFERDLATSFGKAICCPNCGAKTDEERKDDER